MRRAAVAAGSPRPLRRGFMLLFRCCCAGLRVTSRGQGGDRASRYRGDEVLLNHLAQLGFVFDDACATSDSPAK